MTRLGEQQHESLIDLPVAAAKYFNLGACFHEGWDKIGSMSVLAKQSAGSGLDRFHTLYQLLAALSKARALEDVYEAALTSLLAATAADRAAILLFDEDGVMRFKASRGLSDQYQAAVAGHCPWKKGALDARALTVADVLADENLEAFRSVFLQEGIRGLVFLPLSLDAGVFGKFMLYYAQPHQTPDEELELATAIATHVALATEHKRAEIELTKSEERLHAILNNSANVIFLKDLQGRYQLINRRYEELLHITEAEIIGRTDHDIFPPEVADRLQANDRAVLAEGKPLAVEENAPHDDGIHSYISIKFPLHGPDHAVTGVCSIATDITERKKLEAASQRLAAIVESSDDAIVSKDLNGIITSWNHGAERIFGYTAAEAIGQPVAILTAPDRRDEMPAILGKIQRGQRVEQYETRRRRKDGEIIDVSLTVSPVRDSAGRLIGASKIARDITDRKRAERERASLHEREQEARRTAELLNRVAVRLSLQLDLRKLVQEVTDLATTLVGAEFGSLFHSVTNEKGETRVLHSLSGAPPEGLAVSAVPPGSGFFAAAFQGESVVRCDDVTQDPRYSATPLYYSLLNGRPPIRSYLAAPVIARSGEVLGGLLFGHSAPARFTQTHAEIVTGIAAQAAIAMDNARLFEQTRWVQEELKRSNEELRLVNRDLEIFAYSASHDLQEPLRTISISAQLIERSCGPRLQGEEAIFLGNILTASQRMGTLIEDLLAYTKATKYADGPAASVDSAAVLDAVCETLRVQIAEAGATITATALPAVAIHESRLAQLFQNLISNAIKYRGKEVPRVHVAAEEQDGWCVFSVADNGIGIEPQFADQIFGLFKRLHGCDEYPGSGIGLAICQRVVEQYGGRIWLEQSSLGGGSTFCFSLPSRNR